MSLKGRLYCIALIMILVLPLNAQKIKSVYPCEEWESMEPEKAGLRTETLDTLAILLSGRGCIIKNGYMIKSWGDPSEQSDWLSSVKPIFSTILFFAIEEGRIPDVHYKLIGLDWNLNEKDKDIEFYHLANMTSGYARPEAAGDAWAYNDYSIQLYQKSLFERLFKESPGKILYSRLGCLQFQDSVWFSNDNPRIYASTRDFARFGLFWMNMGNWNGTQVLPRKYFKKYMKPHVPKNLPLTIKSEIENDDYLMIGTFGGGSAHFTHFGSGTYGFNWWFNKTGLLHPETVTWPDATPRTFMSIGARGNNMVIIPEYQLILSSAKGNWGDLKAGDPNSNFNKYIKLLLSSVEAK
jgi:CubicO group peptidase (beta-lactamase class C family)